MEKIINLARFRSRRRPDDGAYERCVLCWKLTDVPRDMPISLRDAYIEGQGQLCRSCYCKLFGDYNTH